MLERTPNKYDAYWNEFYKAFKLYFNNSFRSIIKEEDLRGKSTKHTELLKLYAAFNFGLILRNEFDRYSELTQEIVDAIISNYEVTLVKAKLKCWNINFDKIIQVFNLPIPNLSLDAEVRAIGSSYIVGGQEIYPEIESITISPASLQLDISTETYQLTAIINPATIQNPNLVWISSDITKAIVNDNGLVTFFGNFGDVTISVLDANGSGATDSLTINLGLIDTDDNFYELIQIGTQVWTKENWKCTKDKTGVSLYGGDFKYPDGNNDNKVDYGLHYGRVPISTLNLVPNGWRLPTISDINTLALVLNAITIKEVGQEHWDSNNNGTDTLNFSLRGAGFSTEAGQPSGFKSYGMFWTSSIYQAPDSYYLVSVTSSQTDFSIIYHAGYQQYCSIRLIKN